MTVEVASEFSLWPSFAAADSIEADTAAAAAAVGLLGGGSFTSLRASDISPLSMSPQLGFDLAGTTGNDQLFHSAEAANAAELFALLQQEQQPPPGTPDEQCIDAEISRLLQMKQALHRQRQQPVVAGQGQNTAARILEDEPYVMQPSLAMQAVGSSCAVMVPPVSLSLDQSLPMDCMLTPAQSAALDNSQEWAWATNAAAATAAHVARQPMRHSIDLGGLAQRMTAFDINTGSSHSFTTVPTSCNFSGAQQHLPVSNTFAEQQSRAAAAAAAALSSATGPYCGAGLATTAGLPPAGAGLAGSQLAAHQLAGQQLALQSALYMPVSNSSRVSMEQPGLPHISQASTFNLRAPPVNRIPTGRLSLDVTAASSLYSSSAAPMGVGAGMQQMGLNNPQAAWHLNSAANRAVFSINTSQRASFDIPLSRTPDGRCPPRKTASTTSTGSARGSPTHATGRRSATFSAEDRPGATRNGGRSGLMHQAPKWAGSHWHPMADVVKSGQIANKGTGVFIPGGVQASAE